MSKSSKFAKGNGNKGATNKSGSSKSHNQGYRNRNSKPEKDLKEGSRAYGGNDISWWNKNAGLTLATASIPFPYAPGRYVPLVPNDGSISLTSDPGIPLTFAHADHSGAYDYPGIMSFGFYPTIGLSKDLTSPVNIAAREMYARVRSKYSSSLAADAPDLMMYCLALDSIYMLIEHLKRMYYVTNLYSGYDLLLPKALLQTMGADVDDFRTNRMYLYQMIVELTRMVQTYHVPDNMDYYKRHMFMCSSVYADAPSKKAQLYVFKPDAAYILSNTDTQTSLKMKGLPYQSGTVQDWVDTVQERIEALMNWDDSYTILGYIDRAYEGETMVTLSDVQFEGILNPVYNPEMLIQIQNLTILKASSSSCDITYDPNSNALLSKPMVNTTQSHPFAAFYGHNVFLSLPGDAQPSADMVTISTRLTSVLAADREGLFIDAGTEIIVRFSMTNRATGVPITYDFGSSYAAIQDEQGSDDFTSKMVSLLSLSDSLSAFTAHPTFVILHKNPSGDYQTKHLLEADNVTSISVSDLKEIHRVCLYSAFNVFKW